MDAKISDDINKRKSELERELDDIKLELNECSKEIENYNNLYRKSLENVQDNSEIYDKLEFVLKLMDSDVVRAKLELVSILDKR